MQLTAGTIAVGCFFVYALPVIECSKEKQSEERENNPEILFLDEPTTGLDPATRKKVWECISRLRKEEGMTVFLTTHYMEEAARAPQVDVMNDVLIINERLKDYQNEKEV